PGGTQYQGGIGRVSTENGSFGKGCSAKDSTGEGGGGGWFGGAGMNGVGAGGGGSGYVLTKDSYKPTGYTPTSEYYFDNVVMESGGNTAGAYGYALITLLQALPFLTVSSYNSTQATFKADHTDPTLLTKIEVFIDDVLKETITTDLTTEKTINYTLEDNALHTLKIVVTDSNNATAEKVLSISKNIMPLPENVNLNDISTKLVEVNAGFKVGKTSIINTLALKNIEASLNNTLVELSEKIKASFDSGDASIEDLTNKLTQANNTIGQLNSKYKVASGSSVVNSCVNKYGFYHGSDYLFLFPGAIQINGLNFVPNIFFTTFELIDSGYFRKFFVFACRGIFTQDFVITAHYHRLETYLKDFKVEGEVLKLNERDVYMDNRGIQLPCQRQGSSFKWQAIKFI
ncbi:glycine rich family protein, partial [Clostridioides difficile CD88]